MNTDIQILFVGIVTLVLLASYLQAFRMLVLKGII
mgnify:CR=1 FL=1